MADNPSDLVGKEFIFEYGVDRILPPSDKTGGVFATEQRAFRRERVTRCRDCKHLDLYAARGHAICKRSCCSPWPVEPDGFCAWGEPREEA